MRGIIGGCGSIALGMLLGIGLTIGASQFLQKRNAPNIIAPPRTDRPDISVVVSAAFVNAQLQQVVREIGIVRQATITLASPNIIRVTASADVSIAGQAFAVDATITLRVTVDKGRVVLIVDSIDAGGLTLGQSLIAPTIEKFRAAGEDQLNRVIQRELQGTGLRLVNVRITPNDLTADFSSQ